VTALLLKYMETEEDAFYCLVHFMVCHGWRGCFDTQLSRLNSFLDFFSCVLETSFPDVFEKIMEEVGVNLVPVFSSNIQTIFIYECNEQVAAPIFDVFLLDGEQVIFVLLLKMIERCEQEILSLEDHDFLDFLRSQMP